MITKENANAVPIVKKYTYETFSDANQPDRSSGQLVSVPKYHFSVRQYTPMSTGNGGQLGGSLCREEICVYEGITSSSRAPLGVTQGSHIAYTEVTEWYGENGENGKIENTYSFAHDKGGSGTPFMALTSYDWKRGHLLKSTVYQNDNGTFVRQKYTQNVYDFREDKTLNNSKVTGASAAYYANGGSCIPSPYIICTQQNIERVYYACDGHTYFDFTVSHPILYLFNNTGTTNVNYTTYVVSRGPEYNNCDTIGTSLCFGLNVGDSILNTQYYSNINFKTNAVISQWIYVSSTIEKVYDENGANPITTVTEYTYDEDDTDGHQTQPIEIAVTNSDRIKQITRNNVSFG